MLTRVEIDGFKSLRDFAIDLEPFTVLIGPNGVGKSNFLEALALLSRLIVMPVNDAFRAGRGLIRDQFTLHRGEPVSRVRFAIEYFSSGLTPGMNQKEIRERWATRYRYELVVTLDKRATGVERLTVSYEELRAMRRDEDRWLDEHPDYTQEAGHVPHIKLQRSTTMNGRSLAVKLPDVFPEEMRLEPTRSAFAQLPSHHLPGHHVLSDQVLLRLDTSRIREPSERIDPGEIAGDGSNLPTVLADVPEPVLGEIRADLVSIVPGISSFDIISDDATFHIEFTLTDGERLPARLASDGTLRILALLTALRTQPSLACIEEVENGVYPARLRALLESLDGATSLDARPPIEPDDDLPGEIVTRPLPPQVILTTHSPVVLDALVTRPQCLRFVDTIRRGGRLVSRVRRLGSQAEDRGRHTVSPREIAAILDTVQSQGI